MSCFDEINILNSSSRVTEAEEEDEEEESEREPERPPEPPPPAGPPPPDPNFVDSTKTAMLTSTAKLSSLCVEAKVFTESKKPTEDSEIFRLTEEFKLLSAQIDRACEPDGSRADFTLKKQHLPLSLLTQRLARLLRRRF